MADDDGRVHFGVARLEVHLPEATSLKGKRALLKRLQARLREDLTVSVAEVGHQDKWQRAVLGLAVTASTATGVERVLDRITAIVERDPRVAVLSLVVDIDTLDAGDGLDAVLGGIGLDPGDEHTRRP